MDERKKARLSNVSSAEVDRLQQTQDRPTSETCSRALFQALANILPPDFEMPLCCCRVPENVDAGEEHYSKYCQAQDSVDHAVIRCTNVVKQQLLVRPHVRIPFMAVCENHRSKMRFHQCCCSCGLFCLKGRFRLCRETDPPHMFHIGCEHFVGRCPHCGSSKIFETYVSLSNYGFQIKHTARMGLLTTDPYFFELMSSEKQQAIKDTLTIPGSMFEICTTYLNDVQDREKIRSIVDQANKLFTNVSFVNEKQFIDAARKNDLIQTALCLAKGISPDVIFENSTPVSNVKDSDEQNCASKIVLNQTALHVAALNNYPLLTFVLIQAGANCNVFDSEGRTPIMYAVEKGHRPIALMLIKAGSNLEARDNNADTALHFAAVHGDPLIVKALAFACYNFTKTNYSERTDFSLYTAGANLINAQDNGGWTPLMWAAENGHTEAVCHLLHFGAKTGIVDEEGNIALHWASMSCMDGVVVPLVNASRVEEISWQNKYGDTPLIIACQRKFRCMAEYLIQKNANVNLKNIHGCTAADVCEDSDDKTAVLLELKKFLNKASSSQQVSKERLVLSDLSKGRELYPIPVVNDIDFEDFTLDFRYVRSLVERDKDLIKRSVADITSCSCADDCAESCACNSELNKTIWYDKEGLLSKEYDFSQAQKEVYECSETCACSMKTCANRVAQKGLTFRLKVRKTVNKGWGVFAAEEIVCGSFVCEYAGEVLPDDQAESLDEDSYLFELDGGSAEVAGYCIDAKRYGNVARFINHSCNPNVWPIRVFWDHQDIRAPHICFFAKRTILTNEEIGFDYGGKFWMIKGQSFACVCGSNLCKYNSQKIKQFIENCPLLDKSCDKENVT